MFAKFALEAKFVSEAWTIAAEFGSIAGLAGIGVFQNDVGAYSCPGTEGGGVGDGVGEGLGVGVEVGVEEGVGEGRGLGVPHALRHWHLTYSFDGAANTPDPRSIAVATTTAEMKPKRA